MNDLLRSSTGSVWQMTVSNDGLTVSATSVPGTTVAPYSVPVLDTLTGNSYNVVVSASGILSLVQTFGPSIPATIQVNSANGLLWQVAPSGGTLATTQITPYPPATADTLPACPFTLSDALSALGQRLYDPNGQFWPDAEKTAYIQESLQLWNALTSYSRGDFTFPTDPATSWYDLTTQTGSLRPMSATDQSIYSLIEYHLLEPQTNVYPLTWSGSTQFGISDLIAAVQRRRDETLGVTGCTVTRITLPVSPGQPRIQLPNDVIDVRRLAYVPATGSPRVLWPTDTWSRQAYRPNFTTAAPGTPKSYTLTTEPWLQLDVNPPPAFPGQWEILVVKGQTPLSSSSSSAVGVPADFSWVIKWGALADLLGRESNAKDDLRAQYSEQRYKQGLSLLSNAPAVLAIRINNQPIRVDGVRGADNWKTTWQAAQPAKPKVVLLAGLNLAAFDPRADAAYSITVSCVRNFPIPVAVGDCIQVGRDIFDVILDEAAHLAAFKQGGEEFSRSIPLHQRFLQEAATQASKLGQSGEYQRMIWDNSQREADLNPREEEEEEVSG